MWIDDLVNFLETNQYLMPVLIPAISYFTKTLIDEVKLNTFTSLGRVTRVKLPPELKEESRTITDEELLSKKMGEDIKTFYERLSSVLTEENLITLNRNIKRISVRDTLINKVDKKFKERDIDLTEKLKIIIGGQYLPKSNKILIYNESFKTIIFHELMHMASTVKKDGTVFTGFMQNHANGLFIGRGLNEGYTQVLTERYFSDYMGDLGDAQAYPYETSIIRSLEQIIDPKFMENCYFRNDLNAVINELSKYSSLDKARTFISDMDLVMTYSVNFNPLLVDKKAAMQQSKIRIDSFLIDSFKNKLAVSNIPNKEEALNEFMSKFMGQQISVKREESEEISQMSR